MGKCTQTPRYGLSLRLLSSSGVPPLSGLFSPRLYPATPFTSPLTQVLLGAIVPVDAAGVALSTIQVQPSRPAILPCHPAQLRCNKEPILTQRRLAPPLPSRKTKPFSKMTRDFIISTLILNPNTVTDSVTDTNSNHDPHPTHNLPAPYLSPCAGGASTHRCGHAGERAFPESGQTSGTFLSGTAVLRVHLSHHLELLPRSYL